MKWWIGCSGYHYKDWRGKFYPEDLPQKKWFQFYCSVFNTIELNNTFYRFPRVQDLKNWYSTSPDNFRITVKAPRLITHYKRFTHCEQQLSDLYNAVDDGLQEKQGCILFQLPPTLVYTQENLDKITTALDSSHHNVIEFRHSSWWTPSVYAALKAAQLAFCSISYPGLPDEVVKTDPVLYYRFHGVPDLYKSPYSDDTLKSVKGELSRKHNTEFIYVYFNNDWYATAIDNAKTFQRLTEK